ncbi:hypothetical protein HYU20_00050 [Candidatus Woesearchaeota archaeon]|nr:hypothetical protein [Candidatus Woesearchaeota archaeon]
MAAAKKGKRLYVRKSFGRRGAEMSLVSVILGVIFIIIMVKAAPFIYTMLFSKSDIEKCRASVSVKAISIDVPSAGTHLFDMPQLNLDCHTRFLIAKKGGVYDGKGVYVGNNRAADFNDQRFGDKGFQDKLKMAVADRMLDCWDMFGKGDIDPFSKLGGDIHCVECYEVKFDDDARKEVEKEKGVPVLADFTQFLANSYTDEKQTTTYSQYLYKSTSVPTQKYDLDLNKQQGVVYFRGTFELADEAAKAALAISTVGGCFIGAKVGLVGGSFFGPVGTVAGGIFGTGVGCAGGLFVGITGADKASGIGKTIGVAVVPVENLGNKCRKLY